MRQSAWLKRLGCMLRAKRQLGQANLFACSRFVEPNKRKQPHEPDPPDTPRNGSGLFFFGYVLRLSKSARRANGLKVEGRSCSRLGGASPDASAT